MQAEKKRPPRNNPWGCRSYADLITQAIESSSEKRLTLSQIYDWMMRNIPYFGNQANSNSSAGWKNSIRHNLSLHKKFLRIKNDEGVCKSSWWTVTKSEGIERTSRRKKLPKKKPKIVFGRQNPLNQKLSTPDPPSQQSSALLFNEDYVKSSILSTSIRNGHLRPKKSAVNDSTQIACSESCPTSAERQFFCQNTDSNISINSSISSYSLPHSFENPFIPVTDDASILQNPLVFNQNQQLCQKQSIYNQSVDFGYQINYFEENFAMEEHFKYPHHLSGSYMRTVPRNDSTQNFAAVFETSGFSALEREDFNILQQPLHSNYSRVNQNQISVESLCSVQPAFNESCIYSNDDGSDIKQANKYHLQDTFVSSATINASPDIDVKTNHVFLKEQEQFNSALQNFCDCISFEKVFQNTTSTEKDKNNSLTDKGSQSVVLLPKTTLYCSNESNGISETSNSPEIGVNKTSEQCKLIKLIYNESFKKIAELNKIPTGSENFKGVNEQILLSKIIEFAMEKCEELLLPSNYVQKVFAYLEECIPPKVFLIIVTEFSFALVCTTKEYQDDKSFYVNSNTTLTAFLHAHDGCASSEHILVVYLLTLLSVITTEFCEMLVDDFLISNRYFYVKHYFEKYLLKIKNIDQKYDKGIPLMNTYLEKIFQETYFLLPSQTQGLYANLAYPHLKNLLESSNNSYPGTSPLIKDNMNSSSNNSYPGTSPLIKDNMNSSSTDSYSSSGSLDNGPFPARNCSLPSPHGPYSNIAMRQIKSELNIHNECFPTNMESESSQPSINYVMLTNVYKCQNFLSQNSLPNSQNSLPQNILNALYLMERDHYPSATVTIPPALNDSVTIADAPTSYDFATAHAAPVLNNPANINVNLPYLREIKKEPLTNVIAMDVSTTVSVTNLCMDNMKIGGGLTSNQVEVDDTNIASFILSLTDEMGISDVSEVTEAITDIFEPQNDTLENEYNNLQGHVLENRHAFSILNPNNHQLSSFQNEGDYPEDLVHINLYKFENMEECQLLD